MTSAETDTIIVEPRKIALVIGNNKYNISPLFNCVYDATDLSDEIEKIGFNVTTKTDLNYEDMAKAIEDFTNSIERGDIVLFFFAGHGTQWKDQNYLIPCDEDRIPSADDLKHRATNIQQVLQLMSAKNPFVIIYLLDCCRIYWLPSMVRSRSMIDSPRGMAPMFALSDSLITFACAPGKTAADTSSNGRNGVFAYHLLKHITKPGEDITMLMRDVTNGVTIETNEEQTPYVISALRKRDIHLVPSKTQEPLSSVTPSDIDSIDIPSSTGICINSKWSQNGVTIVGDNGHGNGLNQLYNPRGLFVDENQTVYIADRWNNRIMAWKCDATKGEVVAGGNGAGNRNDQLHYPTDVIVDKETDSLIICDYGNRRVIRWSRRNDTNGEVLISNIDCFGLKMDNQRFLYISDDRQNEVRRYRLGGTEGTVVAGGNGKGIRVNQLNAPLYVVIDQYDSLFVSDSENHRVMKWIKDAKEGIFVAGGQGQGNALTQLSCPQGVAVDPLGRVYVVDSKNHRVVRWENGATEGNVILGGNGQGQEANQLNRPISLSFDQYGNLYVVDAGNHRVQRFDIQTN